MTKAGSTLDLGSEGAAAGGRREPEQPALMIAWAPFEPSRVGEVALFESHGGARLFGRGAAEGERVVFCRQRPGASERQPPLASPGLSREQLRIEAEGGRLRVERIGRCPMEVAGDGVNECLLEPGDTLLLKGQMLLFCTRRPRMMAKLLSASMKNAPVFGQPDAHGIVGESPSAWRLRDELAWMATADEHTLLLGESGSGKELCARAVHTLSPNRSRGPFVARSAATIPASLVDAELFGNVKGYPNPGMPERPGLIGSAHGGTLFLDEIGELSHGLQANLLRVLDEGGEYHSLGSSVAKRSQFRLVGATNRDPESLKHDLAARLVIRQVVPGLSERREDIPCLVRHLLRRAAEKSPDAVRRFVGSSGDGEPRTKASLVDALMKHRYTTNVRELHALLWRAMSQSKGNAIEAGEWGLAGGPSTPVPSDAPPPGGESPAAQKAPEPSEAEVRASLAEHGGNVASAAQAMGLSSRYVLYRWMKKYGIAG